MIARFGGDTVRCAGYATFGSQALSDSALAALEDRNACLLANHRLLALRPRPRSRPGAGRRTGGLCGQYWRACQLGEPVLLSPEEMAEVLQGNSGPYGQQG